MENVVILETDNVETALMQHAVACLVVVGLLGMNGAINFDNQSQGVAVEVDDEAVDDLLAAKVVAIELLRTYRLPKISISAVI